MDVKLRGFAAHKPDCQCIGHRRQRGEVVEVKKRTAKISMKDEADRKADHFLYSLDPESVATWEHDETTNPLTVPPEITKKYPNLAFHWISTLKLETKGRGYHGWELFKDAKLDYGEGIKRGNDLHLGAMPKELAESYRRRMGERSTEAVIGIQERSTSKMESAIGNLPRESGAEIIGYGDKIGDRKTAGIVVGSNQARGFNRGISRQEAHARIAAEISERKKAKRYVDLGAR